MQLQDLTAVLLTPSVIALSAGIFAVLATLHRVIKIQGTKLNQVPVWWRFLPVIPLVLGVAGAFLPGVVENAAGWGTNVLAGLWAGFLASHGRKLVKRLLEKQDGSKDGM